MLLNCGVGEDSWESLDCKGIQPVHSEDQPWVFFERTDTKAETPILWPPHAKCWLIGKDSDAGRDWGQEEKGTTEDEMTGWHHWLNGHEFEWTLGVGNGQGGLACYDSWGRRVEHNGMTELNGDTYFDCNSQEWKCYHHLMGRCQRCFYKCCSQTNPFPLQERDLCHSKYQ